MNLSWSTQTVVISNMFFFCMIAKPKNKSLSKSDKTFPFLCKPKTKCGREGEGKGVTLCWTLLLFWMVSHSHCEKAFLPSLFHITHSSRHPAFMVLVHSKVTAILSLCDISCEPVGSILTTGLGTCVKKSLCNIKRPHTLFQTLLSEV